ncbi:hypothetical protein AMK59_3711 [Oryctes borbonicus]|uniref:FAM13A-like domain-containing protein n=1 Tax=Oryctes borbonicus TaxID=1629725 RepID=A0A0T6B8P8_9SCAR|nr:hypothetical protein AMK59_3711 [Oryctes borbonicus]
MKMKILLSQEKKPQCGHMVDQDVMKGPNPIDDGRKPPPTSTPDKESKFARVKRMLTCNNRPPSTYDEAKTSCKARKRKERQESISSIFQERKVIRSNSEERPIPNGTDITTKQDANIRRVSSHEDFQKTNHNTIGANNIPEKTAESALIIEENGTNSKKMSPCRDINADLSISDDACEYERRRSNERFSKAITHRSKYSTQGRRPRTKHFPKSCKEKHDSSRDSIRKISPKRHYDNAEIRREIEPETTDLSCDFLQLQFQEKERSPSPVHSPISPPLDLTTLHEQIDCSEPIPSSSIRLICENTETLPSLSVASNRLISSPRNSVIITQRIYLSSEVPQNNTLMGKEDINPREERLKHLSKQINSTKKKIKKYDEEFETKFGYRPSHADKLNDKSMKKLCADLSKMKKEQKQLKEDSSTMYFKKTGDKTENEKKKAECTLQDTLIEIENRLNSKRATSERSEALDQMTNEQLTEEKIAVQKALLYLESMHGRPSNKEDRDLVRPIYERYRQLKRLVRLTMPSNNINELATIHEHETMDFVSLPTQTPETENEKQNQTSGSTDSDTDTSIGENLHSLSLEELQRQQRQTSEEKKELRRSLRQFEEDFQMRTGKKLQKEDRTPMENVYVQYKKAKAKLRLLDALVGKQAF